MKKLLDKISKQLENVVSLDLRALGIFRIFMGLILVIDFLDRLKDVKLFYSNEGLPSLMSFAQGITTQTSFSLNNLNGSESFQALIIFLALILALLFLVGYRTRVVTILLWIFVVSIQNRNYLILQGGDDYIRLLLFWVMFLPLGERLSLDSILKNSNNKENGYISPANIGYIFQIFFLYFFAANLKSDPIWNREFTAIYYALSLDIFVTPVGRFLYQFKDLLKPLTMSVYYIELFVGFIIMFPLFNYIFRTIGIVLIIGLHIGIGTTLDVGHFPWVSIVAVLALIPTETIDFLLKLSKQYLKRIKLNFNFIYDFFQNRFDYKINKKQEKKNQKLSLIINLSVAIIIFTVTILSYAWNVNNLNNSFTFSTEIRKAVVFFRLDQNWAMFAPYPLIDDGWYVIIAKTNDDEVISLFGVNEKTSLDKKPENYYNEFPNERWRKLMANLWFTNNHSYRERLLEYMCTDWNIKNSKKIREIDMYFMLEKTPPPEMETYNLEKLLLATKACPL